MSKPLIVANWKCNPPTWQNAKLLFNRVKKGIKKIKNVEVVVCPPFVYLGGLATSASARQQAGRGRLILGAQDCFWKEGPFTGEISSKMLKDIGCQYVIIGHSERRQHFQETDETVNKKIKASIGAKITPILCIGETEEEKREGRVQAVLNRQIRSALKKISNHKIQDSGLCIAYEPVWAIGSGHSCNVNTAQIINLLIKKIITRLYNRSLAENIRILYGGSVNSRNARDYIQKAGMKGLLVGGASLDSLEFLSIIKEVNSLFS
ncbi:triose-phosphate isomerase [bacterium]|nr:triose-phosphate isomerase [bacterium]